MTAPTPSAESVDSLLERFLAGEPAAVKRVEAWARIVIHFRGFGLPHDEHDDVVQDVVAGLWQAARAPEFRLERGLRALVRHITLARCIDRLRRRRPTSELSESLPDAAPGPYESAVRLERWGRLRWAMRELDDRCRDLIRQHFFEDRPYAEIAAAMGRSDATMRVHMFNCMKGLRRLLVRWES